MRTVRGPLSLLDFRRKVDAIPEPTVRYAVKLLYLTAGRVNELCGRGPAEKGSVTTWTNQKGEKRAGRAGVTRPLCPTRERVTVEEYEDAAHGKVQALRLTLPVLKRREEVVKEIALPLSGEFDPWVRQLANVIGKLEPGEVLLPYGRRDVADWLKGFGLTGLDLGIKENERVLNPLRHMRLSHLVTHYDFNEFDLLMVGGWSPRTALIAGPMGEYLRLAWRKYFPKLLVPLPHEVTTQAAVEPGAA
jgi:hypothetical protein